VGVEHKVNDDRHGDGSVNMVEPTAVDFLLSCPVTWSVTGCR
jgi:hypothetical protein